MYLLFKDTKLKGSRDPFTHKSKETSRNARVAIGVRDLQVYPQVNRAIATV